MIPDNVDWWELAFNLVMVGGWLWAVIAMSMNIMRGPRPTKKPDLKIRKDDDV